MKQTRHFGDLELEVPQEITPYKRRFVAVTIGATLVMAIGLILLWIGCRYISTKSGGSVVYIALACCSVFALVPPTFALISVLRSVRRMFFPVFAIALSICGLAGAMTGMVFLFGTKWTCSQYEDSDRECDKHYTLAGVGSTLLFISQFVNCVMAAREIHRKRMAKKNEPTLSKLKESAAGI
eukprot:TRINITY_DN13674_c0_g1_i1.p1 TRINITY_DN13674_c0_g1~~TRINITY_DN13674_c0_g1_i1.p1  ORF type:complete len:182 (+),score=9.51 TRINITY_DN13674_c0_g1_i1:31-576(+)